MDRFKGERVSGQGFSAEWSSSIALTRAGGTKMAREEDNEQEGAGAV